MQAVRSTCQLPELQEMLMLLEEVLDPEAQVGR